MQCDSRGLQKGESKQIQGLHVSELMRQANRLNPLQYKPVRSLILLQLNTHFRLPNPRPVVSSSLGPEANKISQKSQTKLSTNKTNLYSLQTLLCLISNNPKTKTYRKTIVARALVSDFQIFIWLY